MAGIPISGQAVVIRSSAFTPDKKNPADQPPTYYTVYFGYLGGEVKCSATAELVNQAKSLEGQPVSFSGRLWAKSDTLRVDLAELAVLQRQRAA